MRRSLHNQASSPPRFVDPISVLRMQPAQSHIDTFRFLDLPPEIRNEIFKNLLCTFKPHDRPEKLWFSFTERVHFPKGSHDSKFPRNARKVRHSVETQILRVSKQVYHEAYDVMLKENLFVRITYNGTQVNPVVLINVPVITMDREHILAFKGYAMHHCMYVDDASDSVSEFMVLHRDLDIFCDSLAKANFSKSFFTDKCEHVLNLFDRSSASHALTTKFQERLLKPYVNRSLHGFPRFQISGSLDHALWRRALASITFTFTTSALAIEWCLRAIDKMKNLPIEKVAMFGADLAASMICLRQSKNWDALLADGGPEFQRRFESCAFSVCDSALQSVLALDVNFVKEALLKVDNNYFNIRLYAHLHRSSKYRSLMSIQCKVVRAFSRDSSPDETYRMKQRLREWQDRYSLFWKACWGQISVLETRYNEQTSADVKISDETRGRQEWVQN
ncbi:hypothetical protein BU16DRAFT_47669 [Lophium mytilinum]|uniref:F-box domain-containing protein n=1 Tax=Lophium mytilinum TaxID=390894 RepID=A0A6A6QSQ4_9PEZI|nr:hypothetical protein BU16DRAFT_47669 [Lophium mytilinum]